MRAEEPDAGAIAHHRYEQIAHADRQPRGARRPEREVALAVGARGPELLPLAGAAGEHVDVLGLVAPDATPLVVSDVDGTLTSSENAFLETVALGGEPDARPGAAKAFAAATARGDQPVYVTARGNQFTTATRDWLEHKGFPRGPVRLSPSFVTLPGGDTVAFKTTAISALSAAGLALSAGVGNRATDITAYTNTHVAADHIFIELPEFRSEVQSLLDAHAAVGFTSYDDVSSKL
jgi:hypothetical protein